MEVFLTAVVAVVSIILGAAASWRIATHFHNIQTQELQEAMDALMAELSEKDPSNEKLIQETYIEGAVAAWKKKGHAIDYLDSLTDVPREQKSKILIAAALRHKGKKPKANPYV